MIEQPIQAISPEDKESDDSFLRVNRLQSLLKLAASPVQSIKASRVALDAVATLNAYACVFHRLSAEARLEIIALHQQGELDATWLEQLASRAAADVFTASSKVRIDNLVERYASEGLAHQPDLIGYLGVPLFASTGAVTGVMGVLSGAGRRFNDEDAWWLQTTAHLVSSALACESLEPRLHSLEQTYTAQPASNQSSTAEPPQPAWAENKARKRSVLLVDDDREVNGVIRKFLVRQGYEVDSAFDGLEALRLFQPAEHEVVISDIMMPHMNGWELIPTLRSRAPKLTVFLITGYSQTGGIWNQSFLKQQGVNTILNKPIDFAFLAEILEDAFNEKHS